MTQEAAQDLPLQTQPFPSKFSYHGETKHQNGMSSGNLQLRGKLFMNSRKRQYSRSSTDYQHALTACSFFLLIAEEFSKKS